MRFKKGSKVEVLSKNEVPSGSWRCGEIICGNGHYYTVRYETDLGAIDDAVVEWVSRKSIRPCPPLVELSTNWVPGDVVEVFHNSSWKMATVSKILGWNYFLVRLLGSSHEVKISEFDLRVRQSWQDDAWFVIGKVASNCEDGKCSYLSTLKYIHNLSPPNFLVKDGHFSDKNNANFQESRIFASRTLKRGFSNFYSPVETPARTAQKFRVTEKEGTRHRLLAANPSLLPEKVPINFTEVHMERAKASGAVGCSCPVSLEPNDADNVTCSVSSCSINSNNSFKFPCNFSRGPVEVTESNCSDAESVFRSGYEEGNCLLPSQEELEAEIHRLELHAYRCTMEALHALGPLSWEQETLVTDLRLSLHISNDEHLIEIRNLISPATSMPSS